MSYNRQTLFLLIINLTLFLLTINLSKLRLKLIPKLSINEHISRHVYQNLNQAYIHCFGTRVRCGPNLKPRTSLLSGANCSNCILTFFS